MSTKVQNNSKSSKFGTKNTNHYNDSQLTNKLVEKSLLGLAASDNMQTLKPSANINNLNISDLYTQEIDYLQVFLTGTKKGRSKRFILKDLDRSTRLFEKVFLITDEKEKIKVGEMCCLPKSPILPAGSCSIKFDNELLYLKLFNYRYCERLFKALGCVYKSVTRLDICRDFQRFKTMLPAELIKGFDRDQYKCLSRAKYYEIGDNDKNYKIPQYLRMGKKSTGRQFYLYNKSLELKEVGDKEHIRKTWDEMGFNKEVDVWRLEISINKVGKNIVVHKDTGEMIKIELREIFSKSFISTVYDSGLNGMFRFVENTNERKTRCKEVVLFRGLGKNIKLISPTGQTDDLRMRKIIVKKEIRDLLQDGENREHKTRGIEGRILWVNQYVLDHNMTKYLSKIIHSLALELKTESFRDLGNFVYNYFARKGGLL